MSTLRIATIGALALGGLMAASAFAPASADGWHGRRHWRPYHHHWRPPVVYYAPRPYYYAPPPRVVYAPPAYYAPPPVYYAPRPYYSPGVSVGIGFNLR